VDEQQRELATNRLLEIIRGKGTAPAKPPESPAPAAAKPPAPPVAPPLPGPAPMGDSYPRSPRPTAPATPEPTTPADSTPKRPGMGLLDKVLSKPAVPVAAKPQPAERAAPLPSPVEAVSEQTKDRETAGKGTEGEADGAKEAAEAYTLPDSLLPFAERLKRRFASVGAKRAKKAKTAPTTPAATPPVSRKKKPLVALKLKTAFVKGKRLIGIDIGTAGIKVIELLQQGNRETITNLQMRSIPVGNRKNPASLPVLHAKLLKEMLPPERTRNADIRVLISDKGAQLRNVSIPGGNPKELVNAIKFQIKKDLPFPLDVCEIVYRGYNPKAVGKQDLEILAVDKRVYEPPIALLDELDLLPSVITSAPAGQRFLVQDYAGIAAGSGAVVVVDIGASKTTITILDNEKLILSRTLNSGGDDFTEVLSGIALTPSSEELTYEQAEKYKLDFGLQSERDPGAMKAAILTRPIAERISTEINRSLDFYRRERPGGEIKKIILVGGGALMKRLPEFLAENVGAEIALGSPTARIPLGTGVSEEVEETLANYGPLFLPVLAVALHDGKDLNMIPPSVKASLKLNAARGVIAPAALSVVVMLIALYTLALSSLNRGEENFEKIKQQLKDLDQWRSKSFAAEAEFAKLTTELRDRKADFDSIRIGEPDIPRYLKAISNLTPENLYLEKIETKFIGGEDSSKIATEVEKNDPNAMDMESVLEKFSKSFGDPFAAENEAKAKAPPVKRPIYGRVIELSGIVYSQGTLTDVLLVDFVFSLENSGHFRDVAVDSMSAEQSGKVAFRILCGL